MESEQGKHETAAQVSVAAKASVAAPRFKSQDTAEHGERAAASRAAAAAGGCPLCARVWRGSCGAATRAAGTRAGRRRRWREGGGRACEKGGG